MINTGVHGVVSLSPRVSDEHLLIGIVPVPCSSELVELNTVTFDKLRGLKRST